MVEIFSYEEIKYKQKMKTFINDICDMDIKKLKEERAFYLLANKAIKIVLDKHITKYAKKSDDIKLRLHFVDRAIELYKDEE